MKQSFVCANCGKQHEGPPYSYEIEAPDLWSGMTKQRREKRGELSSDLCTIDDEYFFIKGNLWIPVVDAEKVFNWTVWVSLSKEDFDRSVEIWDFAGREKEPGYSGRLSNELPLYPSSLNLTAIVHTLGVGERPSIQLEPTNHSLALEQSLGITMKRVQQIAEQVIHQS
jgi:hypothetical protein